MAWNPSPEVAAARDFGQKFGADEVVILFVRPGGQFCYASYGKPRDLCNAARKWADVAFDAVFDHLAKSRDGR